MVKNIHMQNVDELCIKYVLNELDPSEIQLVEEAMANDENILIEIESLRSTMRRLYNLPDLKSPDIVRKNVLKLAEIESEKRKTTVKRARIRYAGLLVAATVTVTIGAGFAFNWISGSSLNVDTASALVQPTEQTTPETPQIRSAGVQVAQPVVNGTQPQRTEIEPWVDNHNMLRINVVNNATGLTIAAPGELQDSPRELRPVDPANVSSSNPMMRDIQLTRTQN
jgi:hypothetical protein